MERKYLNYGVNVSAAEVRAVMSRKAVSAAEVSKATGISLSTLYKRLSGQSAFSTNELYEIASYLGVGASDLMPNIFDESRNGSKTQKGCSNERIRSIQL